MRNLVLASALAVLLSSSAHAGGFSGGPVGGPVNDPPACDPDNGDVCDGSGGGDGGSGGGAGGGQGGSGGGSGTTTTPIAYTYGAGQVVFTLDSLPTGASGTQAFYQPNQLNGALGLPDLPGNQSALSETVNGLTVSFHTADFVAGGSAPLTDIRTDSDGTLFGYEGVPNDVGVGIAAVTMSQGPAVPGAIFANFSQGVSYFSVNLYRIVAPVDGSPTAVSATISAYSGLDGTGTLLGSTSGSADGGSGFTYSTIEFANLAGAKSFVIQGGSGLSNYDAITATLGATAAVPEPASWAMMVGGFGLIGGALRRRRTSVRLA